MLSAGAVWGDDREVLFGGVPNFMVSFSTFSLYQDIKFWDFVTSVENGYGWVWRVRAAIPRKGSSLTGENEEAS